MKEKAQGASVWENLIYWLLVLHAVGQCSPRALLEVMVGVTTLCLVVRCSVAGEHLGSPV